jgi:hypothetical protein
MSRTLAAQRRSWRWRRFFFFFFFFFLPFYCYSSLLTYGNSNRAADVGRMVRRRSATYKWDF